MQIDHRRIARRLCISISHADHDRFLKPQHIAEVFGKIAEHRQLGGAGIAENRRHADLAHELDGGVANGGLHRVFVLSTQLMA